MHHVPSFIQIQSPVIPISIQSPIMLVIVAGKWMATNPLSPCPSFMTGNRIGSPFFLNDHFVASMSPSLKLSLLEDRHGCTSMPAITQCLPGRGDRRHSRASHLSRQDEPDQMVTWKVLYARPSLSRQSKNTSIFIHANTKIEVGCSLMLASLRCGCTGRSSWRLFSLRFLYVCLAGENSV